MRLVRLHLQGFKSFKDKTTIQFDDGITGIVGPNGCGKSNIVDALFWVMGEQSAKHLRGNNMKDLIFAGSSKYAPASFAEVTLVLENDTGKHIHVGTQVMKPQEIALTRKLFRNGETEYRINGIPARLKDIHEVFMDTGAGAKSYSIIAQGEINRLVQAKPEERRTMIEEVAGVTKFKMRKRDSLKKIEQTQSNLNRLSDLQAEIYKNLKSLERQAEKAEKAKRLRERIKHHQLIVDSHKEFDLLSDYVNAKRKLDQNVIDLEQASLTKDALELTLEDERIKKTDLMEKVDGLQAEFSEMAKTLAASEERLKHLKKAREEKERHVASRTRENEELEGDIAKRTEKLEELKQKLSDLEAQNFEEMDFSSLEEKVESLREQLTTFEEEVSDLTMQLEDTRSEFTQVDQLVFKNTSKMDEYAKNLEDIVAEIEAIEKSNANFTDELVTLRSDTKIAKEKLIDLEKKHEILKNELDKKVQSHKENDATLRTLSKEVIQIESKRQSLLEINKTGEGVKAGALRFIAEKEAANFEVLGNLIECETKYAKALEALFENTFDALIAKDNQTQDLATWYANNTDKSFDFLMPEENADKCGPETAERLSLKGLTGVMAIEDVLKINNGEFSKKLKAYFNGFYVADNLTAELALKISHDIRFRGLVSVDGNILLLKTLNGLKLSARSTEDQGLGVVQRNNLINELTQSYEAKKEELDNLETFVAELATSIDQMRGEFEILDKELREANTKFVALKSSLESKESSYGTTSSRLSILNNRKNEISRAKLELLEQEEDILTKKENLQDRLDSLSETLASSRDKVEEIKSTYEVERSELLHLQANAKTFHSQVENLNSQISDVETQIARYQEKLEANQELLDKYHEEIEMSEAEVMELENANQDQAETLSEKKSYIDLVRDELTQLLTGMQERENEVKRLTSSINSIEKNNVELNMKVDQIIIDEEILVKNCFDTHRVDLRETMQKFLEYTTNDLEGLATLDAMFIMQSEDGEVQLQKEDYAFEKRFPAALKESKDKYKRYKSELSALGEINWQAIEDYDRQKLRHDFLRTQEAELKKSLEDLELAINHIDEKSKVRFKDAFEEVNSKFTKVFPIIFGGGEARLEIVGDINSTECGIDIIAKPPGKKMQSINLMSGGEKAMTAVSLIFSIFLVKPSPFCLLDEVDAPLDDANVGRFNELLREMSSESQFILITHNKKTMELNDTLYGVTMQEPGVSTAVSVQLH
jgi:chromosome segregation protein